MNALRASALILVLGLAVTPISLALELLELRKTLLAFYLAMNFINIGYAYAGLKTTYGLTSWRAFKKSILVYSLLLAFLAASGAVILWVGLQGSDMTPAEFFQANVPNH